MEQQYTTYTYNPTGNFIQFLRGNADMYLTDNRLTVIDFNPQEQTLIIGTTTLNDKQGNVTLNGNDLIILRPRVSVNGNKSYIVDGNILIITIYDPSVRDNSSEIIIVNLSTKQYQEYDGPNVESYPNGIDGDIVYLSNKSDPNALTLIARNLRTGTTEFRFQLPNRYNLNDDFNLVSKARGGIAIGVNGEDGYFRVISIPDHEVLLEINTVAIDFVINEDGVIYSLETGDKYFTKFDGTTIILQLVENGTIPVNQSSIVAASEDVRNLWIKHYGPDTIDYVNYSIVGLRTKRATFR